ncbi:MAG: hypothetical protein JW717_09330 [Marinilabiliaceae bacterium]|nr:hypothetical protein [Marinilabiliaceae bacterium]
MKTLSLFSLLIITIVTITSCDDLTTNIETNLVANMSADIIQPKKILKNSNAFTFEVSDTINLNENDDLKGYLESIEQIDIKSISCTLNGIPQGESISEITIELVEADLSSTLYNITDNNISETLNVVQELLKSASNYVMNKKMLIVKATGTSTYAPMKLFISIDHKVVVTASVLD